jgi:filamentous hemagglutinin family protein
MSYKNPSPKNQFRLRTSVRLGVAAVAACFLAAPVQSNPVNPVVVNGTASFNQAGNVLTVTNSNGAIINWDKFSIKAGETTHFAQTAASSTVLNRVLNDPTAIYGTLSSNGKVWLVNPAGIMVGPGGRIDTAGFVASTLNISNDNFLAGRKLFDNTPGAGNVVNQGEIRTPAGGSVYLIGSNVANESLISTPQGETILAAGATVSLVDSATPGVKVDITGAAGNATNLGQITAEAGRIGIAGVIVRNSGTLNASSVVEEGGRIFLKASQDAWVDGNGRITTTGTKGGKVEVLGKRVAVTDQAQIDASGKEGGGTILVGGDYQGKNPDVQNAAVSYLGKDAVLKADATEVGAGGTVIVWADDTTRAHGTISARGGANGGDGGFVETSGKGNLSIAGARVDTRAPKGTTGNWLLDPTDINIVSGGYTQALGDPFDPLTNSTITDNDINTALSSSSLTIQTGSGTGGYGGIIMSGATISHGGGYSLSLLAFGGGGASDGNISIQNSQIVLNGGGNLTMIAGWDGTAAPTSANVIADRGNMAIADSFILANNVLLAGGADLFIGAASATKPTQVISAGNMEVVGRNITLRGGDGTFSGPMGRDVWVKSGGNQTLTATGVSGNILLQAGSANNTSHGGSGMYGGGVNVWSDAEQTVTAHTVWLQGGATGHDSSASLTAYGNQTINIAGTAGFLALNGGGSAASYNNQARIQHGVSTYGGNVYYGAGVQTINLGGGGNVILTAGSGTGNLGYYDPDCFAVLGNACRGSSNGASIDNGIGDQTLNFTPGGSLIVTGGAGGTQNWAGVNNKGGAQAIYGSPTITLTGGSSGGSALAYGGDVFELSNDAGIFTEGSGGQWITADTLTINGGTADWGGAGIGNEGASGGLTIVTNGNMSMYGGSSNAVGPHATAAYIGSMALGLINISVGGDLHIQSGSGTSGPALIGSVDGAADIHISTSTGNITMVAATSDVGIGSKSSGHGATVVMESGGDILSTSPGSGKVLIGSDTNTFSSTNVALNARGDISLDPSTLVGVENPGGYGYTGSVRMVAGWATGFGVGAQANTSASYGSIMISNSMVRTGGGSFGAHASDDVLLGHIDTDGHGSGNQGGAVTATAHNGELSVTSISARGADGGEGGQGGNVTLWAKNDVNLHFGGIDTRGGTGGSQFGYGREGGAGGDVTITSSTGKVILSGSILANGGFGGNGSNYYGYAGPGGKGGMGGTVNLYGGSQVILGTGMHIQANGGQGGVGGPDGGEGSAGSGGQGGMGGTISLTSDGKITLQANSQIHARGGIGGMGGAGQDDTSSGSFVTISGDIGWVGGLGGDGGLIQLSSTSSAADAITLSNVILNASGAVGGVGGSGGSGKALSSYGSGIGNGGPGGQGGYGGSGGSISIAASHATGGIQLGNATLSATGGQGGAGGAGGVGKGYSVTPGTGVGYGGAAGAGGHGGAGGSTPGINVTGGSIVFNGAVLSSRGGNGGVGGVAGAGFGFDGVEGFGTSNGKGFAGVSGNGGSGRLGGSINLATGLGDIVSLAGGGTLDAGGGSGQSGNRGGWGENGGSINLTSYGGGINLSAGTVIIKADGGNGADGSGLDAGDGGFGGTISIGAYGGIVVGAISAVGGRGGNGLWDGGYGRGGGSVTLMSYGGVPGAGITTGSINVYGGLGGNSTGGNDYSGVGGDGGSVVMIAHVGAGGATSGRITVNGSINARGGNAGVGALYGYAGNGGYVALTANGVLASGGLTVGSIDVSGGRGGDHSDTGYYYGSGGDGGSIQLASYGGIAVTTGSMFKAFGGDGGNAIGTGDADGGYGGNGGNVMLTAWGGDINLAAGGVVIKAGGGLGGDGNSGYGGSGGHGGHGGNITLDASTGSLQLGNAQLLAAGAAGGFAGGISDGYSSYSGGSGGFGGLVSLTGYGGIAMTGGVISVNGGAGGNAAYGNGGQSGDGHAISLTSINGPITLIGSELSAKGGNGGHSFGYGYGMEGGGGGQITINALGAGDITYTGTTLNLNGGVGGNSANWGNYGAQGGSGGILNVFAGYGGLFINGGSLISVNGGMGGNGANDDAANSSSARPGGDGGGGGLISMAADLGTIGIAGSLLSANGGTGGNGGNGGLFSAPGADSGSGGDGGTVLLSANQNFMQTNSTIRVRGGASGNGGLGFGGAANGPVEQGGAGGYVEIDAGPAAGMFAAVDVIDASGGGGGASGGDIVITAGGAILDNNGGALNLAGNTIDLISTNGGLPSGLAISVDTAATSSLMAAANGAYGGISIINYGPQPGNVVLADNATNPGAGLGGPFSLSFHNAGDLTVGGGITSFTSANNGDRSITSGGTLNYYYGGLASITGSTLLGAGGNLNMYGGLITAGDLKLGASTEVGTLNVDDAIGGNNIELVGRTININANVNADNNVALIAPLTGGTINLMCGVTANGLSATPSSITASNGITLQYTGIAFLAGDLFADAGGFLHATDVALGNISGLVTGNITLDNGSYFEAGKDIDLVLAGAGSTLSLLNGSYFLASPTTIRIDFPNRSGGGIVGEEHMSPEPIVRYGAAKKDVDPCVLNPLLCKSTETDNDVPSIDRPKTDTKGDQTAGGDKDTFGEESDKDDKDKKDKDKKSDEAKDEKKDEKPAQKKVAQCGV